MKFQIFFRNALNTENLFVENPIEIKNAIEWYNLGTDFADAMHLCLCGKSKIYTFDAKFCKAVKELGITPKFEVLSD